MRLMDEAKCHICKRIFCCAKCRQKHQIETHAIAVNSQPASSSSGSSGSSGSNMDEHGVGAKIVNTIYVFCPICEQKPLTLREGMYEELLFHIESAHLPLRCRKCQRQYTKIDDLLEFSKCVDLAQNCSGQNQSCDTDASKVTLKKATVAASTISTQTSPSIARDLNELQHLTPISLFNLRWKAKSRLTQEEFISDSVSSIRNLSSDSVNLSSQQRLSIGQLAGAPDKGKVIRSTSTPLQVYSVFAKPKETLTFNATGNQATGHLSSIYHSGYVLDEHNTPAEQPAQPQQRAWKVAGRSKMTAVTPLRQVMSKSIQKAFVEHGVGMLSQQAGQRRMRLDLSEHNAQDAGAALDLRLSPVLRRTQSNEASLKEEKQQTQPYQILLSAQKLTTESIIITRRSGSLPVSVSANTNGSTASTVYNSCQSVEIITSSSTELSANMPPITPITRIPGPIINKKLIKFDTPHKNETQIQHSIDESLQEEGKEIFYTPNPAPDTDVEATKKERRRQQIVPRQLSGQFSPNSKQSKMVIQRPLGPRARPPLRTCQQQQAFSCVQDVESDDEVFLPKSASTHNDRKSTSESEPGRLWSLVSSVMRLPASLKADKENSSSGSLIRRCASIAGSLVRTIHQSQDDPDQDSDLQTMKRKRTQTLDNQYCSSSSSKRLRIQARRPVERMRHNYQ